MTRSLNDMSWVWPTVVTSALVLCGLSLWHLQSRKTSAGRAAAALERCVQLTIEIYNQQSEPVRATWDAQTVSDVNRRLEEAMEAAKLGPNPITAVEPSTPRRLGETPYLVHVTAIQMELRTLPQIVSFLHHLTASQPSLKVTRLELTAPSRIAPNRPQERWRSSFDLTELVFRPITPAPLSEDSSQPTISGDAS